MNANEREWEGVACVGSRGWGIHSRVACGVGCRSVALKGQNVRARAGGPGNGRPKNIPKPCRGGIPGA